MSAGIESFVADQHIFNKLSSDASLTAIVGSRIYADEPPYGATMPYVLIQFLSGVDRRIVGKKRFFASMVYLVTVVMQTTSYGGNLKTAAERIDAVLHASSGATADGTVFAVVREESFRMTERLEGGVQVRRLGGRYRILAQ